MPRIRKATTAKGASATTSWAWPARCARQAAARRAAHSLQRRQRQRRGRQVQRRLARHAARFWPQRLAAGMDAAWEATEKTPITAERRRLADASTSSCRCATPLLDEAAAVGHCSTTRSPRPASAIGAAIDLAWARRVQADRAELPAAGPRLRAAHAGRAVHRVSTGRRRDEARGHGLHGGLRRLRPGLHRHARSPTRKGATKPATSRASRPDVEKVLTRRHARVAEIACRRVCIGGEAF